VGDLDFYDCGIILTLSQINRDRLIKTLLSRKRTASQPKNKRQQNRKTYLF
jgi:hypothetical protein